MAVDEAGVNEVAILWGTGENRLHLNTKRPFEAFNNFDFFITAVWWSALNIASLLEKSSVILRT